MKNGRNALPKPTKKDLKYLHEILPFKSPKEMGVGLGERPGRWGVVECQNLLEERSGKRYSLASCEALMRDVDVVRVPMDKKLRPLKVTADSHYLGWREGIGMNALEWLRKEAPQDLEVRMEEAIGYHLVAENLITNRPFLSDMDWVPVARFYQLDRPVCRDGAEMVRSLIRVLEVDLGSDLSAPHALSTILHTRHPRSEVIKKRGRETVLVSNFLHRDAPPLTLEEMSVAKFLLLKVAKDLKLELLSWCILPNGYRMVVNTPKGMGGGVGAFMQKGPITLFGKSLHQRWAAFAKYCGHKLDGKHWWRDRYRSTPLELPCDKIAASMSVDCFPVIQGMTDKPELYYFNSFSQACMGDEVCRDGIRSILGMEGEAWRLVAARYRKYINRWLRK